MNAFWRAVFLALVLLGPVHAQAQTLDGLRRLIAGVYVRDDGRTYVELTALLLASGGPETFIKRVSTCADRESTANRLRRANIRVTSVTQTPLRMLTAGRCQVFVTRQFNFALLQQDDDVNVTTDPERPRVPDNGGVIVVPEPRRDTTSPTIRPRSLEIRTTDRRAVVTAVVEDRESAIASVQLRLWDGRAVAMSLGSGGTYGAQIELPPNYQTETVTIVARSAAPDPAFARISVARQPHCGPAQAVDTGLVRSVQGNLRCVGIDPGPVDGQQGQNTCRGIRTYLGAEIESFNAGRLTWLRLNQRLTEACRFAQPVVLSFTSPIQRDADRVDVPVTLSQAGAAARITLSDAGGPVQSRDWRGAPVQFTLRMPAPGQEARYRVQVYDATGRLRDDKPLILQRPGAVLRISPQSPITRDSEATFVTLRMEGGESLIARIEATGEGLPRLAWRYVEGGIRVSLRMPPAGEERTLRFAAFTEAGRSLAAREVVLRRPAPDLPRPDANDRAPLQPAPPRTEAATPASTDPSQPAETARPSAPAPVPVEDPPAYDASTPPLAPVQLSVDVLGDAVTAEEFVTLRIRIENPGQTRRVVLRDQASGLVLLDRAYAGEALEEQVRMPVPGQSAIVTVAALNTQATPLAQTQIALARVVPTPVPPWVWPAGGLALLLGGGLLGMRLRKSPEPLAPAQPAPAALVKPVVSVHPDEDPHLALPDATLPALVVWVEQTIAPKVEIDLPKQEDDAT